MFLGFPRGSAGKELAYNPGDLGFIPGLGRSPGEGKGYPLQDSGLEKFLDYTVHGVAKSQTQLSGFHFHFSPVTDGWEDRWTDRGMHKEDGVHIDNEILLGREKRIRECRVQQYGCPWRLSY